MARSIAACAWGLLLAATGCAPALATYEGRYEAAMRLTAEGVAEQSLVYTLEFVASESSGSLLGRDPATGGTTLGCEVRAGRVTGDSFAGSAQCAAMAPLACASGVVEFPEIRGTRTGDRIVVEGTSAEPEPGCGATRPVSLRLVLTRSP